MGSIRIKYMRDEYPGKSDEEAARAYAQKYGCMAVVRYKGAASASDFTDIGLCDSEAHIRGYFTSPYCHGAEIIYDGRRR